MAKLSKKFSELNKGAQKKLIKQYGSKSAAKAAHSQARLAAGKKKPTIPLVIAPGVTYTPSDIFKGIDPRSGYGPQPEPQVKAAPPLPPIVTPKPAAPPPPGSRTPPLPEPPPTPPTPDTPTAADLLPQPEPYDDSKIEDLISGFEARFAEMQKENENLRRQMMISERVQMQNMARAGARPQLELGVATPGSDMYGTGAFRRRRRFKIKPTPSEGLSIGAAPAMQGTNKMLNV